VLRLLQRMTPAQRSEAIRSVSKIDGAQAEASKSSGDAC